MKERPILFSAPMVRAILDGRKTQTRRTVKIQHPLDLPNYYATGRTLFELENQPGAFMEFRHTSQDDPCFTGSPAAFLLKCPYGQPGDRLWVRESTEEDCAGSVSLSRYRADGAFVLYSGCDDPAFNGSIAHWNYPRRVLPSIHMPRWASRILLEIVSVRVERLNEISEADACAEGIECEPCDQTVCFKNYMSDNWIPAWGDTDDTAAILSFESLWESINGQGSWQANPWVWVVEFKVVEPKPC